MSSPTNDNKYDTAVQDAAVAAIDSTTVDEDNSAGGGVCVFVPETKPTMMMLIYWLTR
jgi:hypothetical protein